MRGEAGVRGGRWTDQLGPRNLSWWAAGGPCERAALGGHADRARPVRPSVACGPCLSFTPRLLASLVLAAPPTPAFAFRQPGCEHGEVALPLARGRQVHSRLLGPRRGSRVGVGAGALRLGGPHGLTDLPRSGCRS